MRVVSQAQGKLMSVGRMRQNTRRVLRQGAIALAACAATLLAPLAWAADEWADWRVAGAFVCRADFSLADYEPLLGELADLQEELVRVLGIAPAEERIELYLFRNEADYRNYLAAYFPEVPYRRALYIKRGGPGVVLTFRSGQLATDLRHECTHALLHAVLPMVPLWLDEGLAEFFEVAPEQRPFGNPHLSKVRWNARFGIRTPIAKLEKKGSVGEMGGVDYRDSWAWVHFILYGSAEAHAELVGFLREISANVPPGKLSVRLSRRIADLDRQYLAHFRGWAPKG